MDCAIAAHPGQFLGRKSRAAVAWRLHTRTGLSSWLERCRADYRSARDAWGAAADAASGYVDDVPLGQMLYQRGRWRDRLPAIDADLPTSRRTSRPATARRSAGSGLGGRAGPTGSSTNIPEHYEVGHPLPIKLRAWDPSATVRLHHRAVDQSSRWECSELTGSGHERRGHPRRPHHRRLPGPVLLELRRQTVDGDGTALRPSLDQTTLSDQPTTSSTPTRAC